MLLILINSLGGNAVVDIEALLLENQTVALSVVIVVMILL
jgi:hypothetical protein